MLSTLLSLVFVPAMFVLIDKLENWVRGLFSRWRPVASITHTPAE